MLCNNNANQKGSLSRDLFYQSFLSREVVEKDRENFTQIQTVLSSHLDIVIQNNHYVQQAIQKFAEQANALDNKCQEITLQAFTTEINQGFIEKCEFLLQLSNELKKRFAETVNQTLSITELASENGFEELKNLTSLLAKQRFDELNIFSKRIALLITQENHEIELKTTIHNQQLKAETEQFDRLMKEAKFKNEQDQTKFDEAMKEREQSRLESIAFEELAIKRLQINNQKDLEEIKLQNDQEIKNIKLHNEKETESLRINAQERVHMANIQVDKMRAEREAQRLQEAQRQAEFERAKKSAGGCIIS